MQLHKIKNSYTLVLVLMLSIFALPALGMATELRVGVYEQKPGVVLSPDGKISGILGEMLQAMARHEGWTLQPVPCDWETCMSMLSRAEIDLLPDVHYNNERARQYSFHHIPAMHSWSQVYARQEHKLFSIEDLNGHSLALLAGSSQNQYLRTTFNALGIQVHIDNVDQLERGFKRVQMHQSDAVAADYFFGDLSAQTYGLTATPIIFNPTQVFYAAPLGKHPEILAAIDHYLGMWQSDPESVYYRIIEDWRLKPAPGLHEHDAYWLAYGLGILLLLSLLLALLLKRQLSRQTQLLSDSELHLETILDSIDAMVSIKGPDRRIVFANRKLESFLGSEPGGLIGYRDEDFLTDPESIMAVQQSDQEALQSGSRTVSQYSLKRPGHEQAISLISFKACLINHDGELEGICSVSTDITERVRAEETAHRLTYYDTLTDLPNRRTMMDRLQELLEDARENKAVAALLVVDLDGFKRINDVYGHAAGDKVLCHIACLLVQSTRTRDLIARVSADEFIVLLTGLGNNTSNAAHKGMHVAEKLRTAIGKQAFTLNDGPVYISASIGLTLVHQKSNTIDSIMREADLAIMRAKRLGGNLVSFYERDLQSEAERRIWLEHDLLKAINSSQLSMHLQAQYGHDGRVTGGELLARWQHPQRGDISPGLFIPVAEETGLIAAISEWSVNAACQIIKTLQDLGQTYPVSLNISPKRLMDQQFAELIFEVLERNEVPGNRFIFEVTEGILIQDIEAVAQRMEALARFGIRFSIDDFGTGYSNLAYLKRLPLYELKIDKSLIRDIPHDDNNAAIVRMILSMADQLNLRVVAEGVETREQLEFLTRHDCHAVQGYLLSRPMSVDSWLKQIRQEPYSNILL